MEKNVQEIKGDSKKGRDEGKEGERDGKRQGGRK